MISCGWWLWLMVAVAVAGGCGKLGRWLLHAVARGCGWCPVILALAVSLAVVLAGDWWLVAVGMAEGVAVAVATYLRLAQLSLFPIAHSSLRALSLAAPFSLSLPLSVVSLLLTLPIYVFNKRIRANRGMGLVHTQRTSNKAPHPKRNIPNISCIHFYLLMPRHPFVLIRPQCIDIRASRQAMCIYDCAHW